jgi:hypothetical protein
MADLQILQAVRVNAIMRALQDTRELPGDLIALRRTPIVPAADGEIMARFTGRVLIADLVADDQKAAVYSAGKFTLERSGAPNLKLGQMLTQEQLKMLEAVANGVEDETGFFNDTENYIVDALLLGVRQRMEAIRVASWIDGFSYNRLGIRMENVTWGMPADLKVTLEVPVTDHANCKIVTYISQLKRRAQVRYGIMYDRWTLSRAAFDHVIQCDEFKEMARTYLAPNVSFVNLNTADTRSMQTLEFYDSRYWSQDEDGSIVSEPFLPINKSALSSRANDNSRAVADFANGVPTEVTIANLGQGTGMIGTLPRNTRGPVAYVTAEHNPPQVTYWGVARGWARKHMLQETAAITLAPAAGEDAIEETIEVGEPEF